MNEELTLRWCDEVLGQFAFQKRLLAWDSFEAHITDVVKRKLTTSKTESLIVPGGCGKYIQARDLVKHQRVSKYYENDWRANSNPEKHGADIVAVNIFNLEQGS